MVRHFIKIVAAAVALVEVTTTFKIKEECNQTCLEVSMEADVEVLCFKTTTLAMVKEDKISKVIKIRTIIRLLNANSLKVAETVLTEISVPSPMDLLSCRLDPLKCHMETMVNRKWIGSQV